MSKRRAIMALLCYWISYDAPCSPQTHYRHDCRALVLRGQLKVNVCKSDYFCWWIPYTWISLGSSHERGRTGPHSRRALAKAENVFFFFSATCICFTEQKDSRDVCDRRNSGVVHSNHGQRRWQPSPRTHNHLAVVPGKPRVGKARHANGRWTRWW